MTPLARVSRPTENRAVDIVMLSAFGDESADETKQRVFAVAAVFGRADVWGAVEKAWLARTDGIVFHAAKCESEYANDPDRSKHQANLALYADLAQIIGASDLAGMGVALDLESHRACLPDVPADVEYYKCLTDVVGKSVELAAARFQEEIEFTFDHRRESEYNVGQLYDCLINMPEWRDNIFLRHKVSFDSRMNPRIQVADLVARETMKALDNRIGPVKRPERKSMLALLARERFGFDLLGREYCESWRDQMPELTAKAGFTEEEFARWLRSHKLSDNWSNRFRYFIWRQRKDTLS